MTSEPDTQNQDPGIDDPYQEPANSTVDDWIGQSVDRDAELVDELVEEAGGDLEAAEAAYEAQSDQGATHQAKNRPDH